MFLLLFIYFVVLNCSCYCFVNFFLATSTLRMFLHVVIVCVEDKSLSISLFVYASLMMVFSKRSSKKRSLCNDLIIEPIIQLATSQTLRKTSFSGNWDRNKISYFLKPCHTCSNRQCNTSDILLIMIPTYWQSMVTLSIKQKIGCLWEWV